MEEWRPIKQSRGQYEASSEGRVRNARTGRVLRQIRTNNRMLLNLNGFMGGRSYSVGQLVYSAFHPGEINYRVFHKNGDTTDNRLENLYCIIKEEKDG